MPIHLPVDKFEAGAVLVEDDFKVGDITLRILQYSLGAPLDNEGAVGRRSLYSDEYPTTAASGGVTRRRQIAKVREERIVETWNGQARIEGRRIVAAELQIAVGAYVG